MQTYSDTNTVTVLLPRRGWKPRKFISITELKRPVKLQIGYVHVGLYSTFAVKK